MLNFYKTSIYGAVLQCYALQSAVEEAIERGIH